MFPFAKEVQRLDKKDAEILFYGLAGTNGSEEYEGGLWEKTWSAEEERYVLIMNISDEAKNVSVTAEGIAVKMFLGGSASFENNVISVSVNPGETYFFKMLDEFESGMYIGNVMMGYLAEGSFELKNEGFAVLYTGDGHSYEMKRVIMGNEIEISELKTGSILKLFSWESFSSMLPYGEPVILRN